MAAIIFLHGSGDTGAGIQAWLKHVWGGRFLARARKSNVEVHFPTASPRPYTLAGGQVSSVWFDRYALPPTAPEHTPSVEESCHQLGLLVDDLVARGVPARRIAIGGFSMGGGIALQCMLRSPHKLGACFALSAFMCERAAIFERLEKHEGAAARARFPPCFIRHGAADDFILPQWGRATADRLLRLGLDVDFDLIPGVRHELSDGEVEELSEWVFGRLMEPEAARDEAGSCDAR